MWNQRPRIAKAVLSNKSKARGIIVLDFQNCDNSIILAQKQTYEQQNRIKDAETTPNIFSHLIFDQCADNVAGEKVTSLTNSARKIGYPHAEE